MEKSGCSILASLKEPHLRPVGHGGSLEALAHDRRLQTDFQRPTRTAPVRLSLRWRETAPGGNMFGSTRISAAQSFRR